MAVWLRGVAGAVLLLLLARAVGIGSGLNRWITDAHWRWRAARRTAPYPGEILVVAIDDKSLQKLGRLRYWSRARYAELLDRAGSARAVGIDVVFDEPDRFDPQGDRRLVEAVRRHGRVVVAFHQWTEARPVSPESQAQTAALLSRLPPLRADLSPYPLLPFAPEHTLQAPISGLVHAGIPGYVDVDADPDNVYRTPILLKFTRGKQGPILLPHFSLALACAARGVPLADVVRGESGGVVLGTRQVMRPGGRLWLQPITRRAGARTAGGGSPAATISFVDALRAPPETFQDKILLVGETATGTADIRPTPLDHSLRGVEFNADLLVNLLTLPPAQPLPAGVGLLLFVWVVGATVRLYYRWDPRSATIGAVAALASAIGVMEYAFWSLLLVPVWDTLLMGFLGVSAVMLPERMLREAAQKRELRQSFSLYVPPELVEEILDDPELARQEGTRQRVAVLFSDIRKFTTYSEQHEPEFVVRQMRQYLDEMTEAVMDARGVLDKYIGDAVMALFGPFLPAKANLSALAVMCALDMLDRLDRLNERWAAEEMPPFRIGIGVHVGDAIVGNIGSKLRMQLTALGDTVNLASRLQTLTKQFQAVIIVTEVVKEEAEPVLRDRAEFLPRGLATVTGREQPEQVYEVIRKGIAD